MNSYKSFFILFILAFATIKLSAQADPFIFVLPSNSGIVSVGATNDLEIVVGNANVGSIAVSKLRPIVTIPASVTFLPNAQQPALPAGWTILSNTGSQLRVCNTSDVLEGFGQRTIILKVIGVTVTPPQTFLGQINFGNGTTCAPGPGVSGDALANNGATSTIEVIAGTLPLTLVSFKATLLNCLPSLKWVTQSEVNTDRFEIEKNAPGNGVWKSIGEVAASGSNSTSIYSFSDNSMNSTSERVLYRLKMIDKDGSYKYSDVLPVSVNCKVVQVSAFPNPVQNGKLFVSLTGTTGQIEANLLSISGQMISKNIVTNGTNFIDVSGVANGTYILNIMGANGLNKKVKVMIGK